MNFGNLVKKHFKAFLFSADVVAMLIAVFVAATLKFDAAVRYQNWFTDYLWAFMLIDIAVTTISLQFEKYIIECGSILLPGTMPVFSGHL